jgi:NAD-dependent dihydropyrimidine dehydrogenase PreA subunit
MSIFHNVGSEGGTAQRTGLYVLARYLELPFLWLSYRLLRGKWKRAGNIPVIRRIFAKLIVAPVARHVDTGSPMPYREVLKHIDALEGAIAVGTCRCRITNNGCGHALETDIVVRTGEHAFSKAFPNVYRPISKEQAKKIVLDCHDSGLFPMVFYHCPSTGDAEYAICNCCECGCAICILNRELGDDIFPLKHGGWVAVTDKDKCTGHGACVAICPFNAREVVGGNAVTRNCFGCGLCEDACPENAIVMKDIGHGHNHPH